MIVCFVIDTSVSMNQRCANGMSILDCCKALVEHFLKVRGRHQPNSIRNDRYFLVTCAENMNALKVRQLKNT